ncbi:MAG: DUF4097 domain-containing protein [Eggerthellaceae bacterium]|nr:DUF4097 domain-containing protein [Eggerthellaceae bacterium]
MARLTAASYVKISLIVLLALVICSAAALNSCTGWFINFPGTGLSEIGNAKVDANKVRNIDINWAAGSVDIKLHTQSDEILLIESATGSLTRAQAMRWQLIGDTLRIDYGTWSSCSYPGTKHLEILIPEKYAGSLGRLDINGASGRYSITDIGCSTLKISLASGSLNATGMAVNDLRLEVASGNSFFDGVVANNLLLDTASGRMEIVCRSNCPKTIDANMASGTITLSIPEKDGFTASISQVSGRFNSDFSMQQQGHNYVYNGGGATIKANIVSGTFNLRKS